MSDSEEKIALKTIDLLEHRLHRINLLLSGYAHYDGQEFLEDIAAKGKDETVRARLAKIERDLNRISTRSTVFGNLLKLYAAYPELFPYSASDPFPATALTTSELLAIISACATSYPTTASRLTSIKDVPIPPVESSLSLIALQPRLTQLELLQEGQERELADLRLRSATAIKRWYELGVLAAGECWVEWEGRVTKMEKRVRREEARYERESRINEAYQS